MPEVMLGGSPYYDAPLTESELREPIPPPVQFAETIEALRERVAKMVGRVSAAKNLNKPHRIIARLLAKDDERRRKAAESSFGFHWDNPKFESPFERRRLRILNSLFLALERVGGHPDFRGAEARDITVTVGYQHIGLTLDRVSPAGRRRDEHRQVDESEKRLELEAVYWLGGSERDKASWQDDEGGAVETKLTEVTIQILLFAEMQYRGGVQHQHDWRIERKAKLEKEDERRRIEVDRAERARQAAILQARIDRLLQEADNFRKANDIREYVKRVQALTTTHEEADLGKVRDWARWALAEADRIDPVNSARFLEPIQQ
jgi:hypothetical protein